MKFNLNTKVDAYVLTPWFAWHPVIVEEGQVVWLETIYRGRTDMGLYYYRARR